MGGVPEVGCECHSVKKPKDAIYQYLLESIGDAFVQSFALGQKVYFRLLWFAGAAGIEKRSV